MLRKILLAAAVVSTTVAAQAQTTYLPLNTEDYHLLDRLETRSGELTNSFFTSIKPTPRNGAIEYLWEKRQKARELNLSALDRYNIDQAISVSGEWAPDEDGAIDSRRSLFKTFYKKQPDFLHVKTKDFFLSVNPVMSAQLMNENNSAGTGGTKYWSARGLELRGWISKRIGFYTYVADNQEQVPGFVDDWATKYRAVPGGDFYRKNGSTYDYFMARGYVDFALIKNKVNVTFGHDNHFIGDGARSLYISNFSAPATFLRINTKIWKLNYQNLFLELTPQYLSNPGDARLPRKYATIHTLSINATKWLNIGFYEAVMFSRRDRFEFGYMIPLIFYRGIERGMGSPDNVNIGLNFKAVAAKHFQFYGQLLLDEFKASELFGNKGWWANKWGIQLGAKYFDALGIKNLDLQGEINVVRPYTYTHRDSTSNFTHYNQPLAHPLGAGFQEVIGILRYQPAKNLFLTIKGMYYRQGLDTGMSNFGSNIFADYVSRNQEYGVKMINGVQANCMSLNLHLAYELRPNLFIDIGGTRRAFEVANNVLPQHTTTYFYGGFRLNIARRDYDFY